MDSLLLWGGVVDEVDFADRLSQWARNGFSELGDTVGWGIGRTVGKVYYVIGRLSMIDVQYLSIFGIRTVH